MEVDPRAVAATALTFAVGGYALAVAIRRFRIRVDGQARCALCDRPRAECRVLIAADSTRLGPIYVCDRCARQCVGMVEQAEAGSDGAAWAERGQP